MAKYLLDTENVLIYGMMRRTSNVNQTNILEFKDDERFSLVYGDLTDDVSVNKLVKEIKPDYLINFGVSQTLLKLHGMFAFAFFDRKKNKLFLCKKKILISQSILIEECGKFFY